jgi:hypothetical protein
MTQTPHQPKGNTPRTLTVVLEWHIPANANRRIHMRRIHEFVWRVVTAAVAMSPLGFPHATELHWDWGYGYTWRAMQRADVIKLDGTGQVSEHLPTGQLA